jgi:hypothetical protein
VVLLSDPQSKAKESLDKFIYIYMHVHIWASVPWSISSSSDWAQCGGKIFGAGASFVNTLIRWAISVNAGFPFVDKVLYKRPCPLFLSSPHFGI